MQTMSLKKFLLLAIIVVGCLLRLQNFHVLPIDGHAVHPDAFAVTLTFLALALYVLWRKNKNIWLFAMSVLALTLSIGTRPFNLLVVPSFIFLAWTYKAYWWEYPFIAFGGLGLYK